MLNKKLRLSKEFLPILVLLFWISTIFIYSGHIRAEEYWEDLRIYGRQQTGFSSEIEEIIIDELQDILSIFQKTPHLNPPPRELSRIRPEITLHKPPEFSHQQGTLPRAVLNLRMWFAGQGIPDHSGLVSISVNEPEDLLGQPALIDEKGGLYLLPPVIEQAPEGPLYSRAAHPPGYEEEYPCYSFFPLWGPTLEPFLRSVFQPLFNLGRHTGVAAVLTVEQDSFWEPVTQERWIKALKEYARAELKNYLDSMEAAREVEWTDHKVEEMRRMTEEMKKMFSAEATIEMHENLIKNIEETIKLFEFQLDNPVFYQLDDEREEMIREQIEMYEQEIDSLNETLEERILENQKLAEEWLGYMEELTGGVIILQGLLEDIEYLIEQEKWAEMGVMAREHEIDHLLFLAEAGQALNSLEAELQQLSAVERAAPAYGFDVPPLHPLGPHRHVVPMYYEAERPSGLISPDKKGARAVVAVRPDFFENEGEEGAIKLLAVNWWEMTDALHYSSRARYYSEARVNMRQELWRSLDWTALRQKVK